MLFSIMAVPIYNPTNSIGEFPFPHSLKESQFKTHRVGGMSRTTCVLSELR